MQNDDFTIIVDTREQQPWHFKNYATANHKLDTGDYSVEGLEKIVTIERKKSVNEFANNIVEKRFKDWTSRLSEVEFPFVLLEFSLDDVLRYPVGSNIPKRMWDKIKISPNYIIKNLLELNLHYNINVVFCDNHRNAEHLAEQIFKRVYYLDKNRRKSDET
jgi:ERCC4-type nuclease